MTSNTAMARLHQKLVARLKEATESGERGVALMSVMLFMILLTGMSLVLLAVLLGQIGPSYVAQKSTKTVYSAQAGIQAALGVVRSAAAAPVAGQVFGAPSKLPCSFTGNVDGSASPTAVSYAVSLQYYLLDPTGKTEPWLSDNDLACSPTAGVSTSPKFAYIVSVGAGASAVGRSATEANRSVAAIYKFKVTTVNIPGGRVYDPGHAKCLEAVSATAGSLIRFIPVAQCTTSPLQLWIYDTTYQIKLASTTVAGATPLCISGSASEEAKLIACLPSTDPNRWNQIWAWNDGAAWEGQKQVIADGNSGRCLQMGPVAGVNNPLVLSGCGASFDPSPQVGAGAAGYNTHQMVNFKEFGRCADVTDKEITRTFMIVYPCKQDPTGTGVYMNWNHKWYYTEPAVGVASAVGEIYVNQFEVNKFCLRPSGTPRDVVFGTCTGAATQQWTRFGDSPDQLKSYTIRDSTGKCLDSETSGAYGNWSIMRLAVCDGSTEQKWNAPPTLTDAVLGGYKEVG